LWAEADSSVVRYLSPSSQLGNKYLISHHYLKRAINFCFVIIKAVTFAKSTAESVDLLNQFNIKFNKTQSHVVKNIYSTILAISLFTANFGRIILAPNHYVYLIGARCACGGVFADQIAKKNFK